MKMGFRTPSPGRSFTAQTTGAVNRTIKRSIDPTYGKKGMGYIKDPKRAVYNNIYSKTTYGVKDIVTTDSKAYNREPYYDNTKSKVSKSWVFFPLFILGVVLCAFSHFAIGAICIVMAVVIALVTLKNDNKASDDLPIDDTDDYKPFSLDNAPQSVATNEPKTYVDDLAKKPTYNIKYDEQGNGIYIQRLSGNKFMLCHIDKNYNSLGQVTDFPSGSIYSFRISNNGLYALLILQSEKVFFVDLKNHVTLWGKRLNINNYKIKDITDTEIIFQFRCSGISIDFSLDHSGEFCNIDSLVDFFVEHLSPVTYHSDSYVLVINELLKDFANNKEKILKLYGRMTTPKGVKYFSTKKIASVSKSIGVGYFETGDYKNADSYFKTALMYNPKIGVKTYMNKLEKLMNE